MRYWIAGIVLVLAGCSHSENLSDFDRLPKPVQAAFIAAHPYGEVDHPKKETAADGSERYVLPYKQPGGATGQATYAVTGELLDGE